MSNTIAVYNFKGGVGKTSTALSLAYSWSRSYKVLLIDCDPQTNLSQSVMQHEEIPPVQTLFNLTKKLLHNDLPKIDPVKITPYLHLIPGHFDMATIEANTEFISFGHIIFYKLLSSLRHQYDFIILDCPSHFGVVVKSFIANIDSILIPAIPDSFSLDGLKKLLSYLYEVERTDPVVVLGIFFNQVRKHTLFHQRVIREAEQELGHLILDQRVRESIRVGEANDSNQSIYSFIDQSAVAEDFLQLSEEIIGRMNTTDLDVLVKEFQTKVG